MEISNRLYEFSAAASSAACPVCGGPVLNVGGSCRCMRCCYSICESCEGGWDDELLASDSIES